MGAVYEVMPAGIGCAFDALEGFAREHPDDLLAGIYLDRVVGFLLEPPPDDWDGIIHFSRK